MKPKWLVVLGVCIAVASLLLSCSTGSGIVPVTGNESMLSPDTVIAARDNAATYIQQYAYEVSNLPAYDTWKVSVDERATNYDLYTFSSGDWIVLVREPNNMTAARSVTYMNTKTDFVWHGFVDADGNVSFDNYTR